MPERTPEKKEAAQKPAQKPGQGAEDATAGVHPAPAVSDADDATGQVSRYEENPDKPDETSVAQVEVVEESKRRDS